MPDSVGHNVACRICMDSKDNCVSLFSHDLSKKFTEVADIQVEKDDGLPETICMECESDLEKCYEFRLKVQVADKKFRENIKFSQVDIVEYNIKQEGYAGDETSENGDDRDSLSMDDDEPDVAQKNQEENDEIEPYPMNHVAVIEQREGKTKMSEDLLNRDQAMIDEPEVGKFEEPALDALTCMKEEAEAEIMDIDNNQLDPFGTSSSVSWAETPQSFSAWSSTLSLIENPYTQDFQKHKDDQLSLLPTARQWDSRLSDLTYFNNSNIVRSHSMLNNYVPMGEDLSYIQAVDVPGGSSTFRNRTFFSNLNPESNVYSISEQVKEETSMEKQRTKEEIQIKNKTVSESLNSSKLLIQTCDPSNPKKFQASVENEFFCQVCNVDCGSVVLLEEHKSRKNLICRTCTLIFDNHSELEVHFTHHKKYTCKFCKKIFYSKKDIIHHKKTVSPCNVKRPRIQCEYCNKKFLLTRNLTHHMKFNHSHHRKFNSNSDDYVCQVCNRRSKNKAALIFHLKETHDVYEGMECKICYKIFLGPRRLKNHIENQHVEASKRCLICQAVVTARSFKDHMETHDEPGAVCTLCGATVKNKNVLKSHMKTHRDTEACRTFPCHMCNETFNSLNEKIRHKRDKHKTPSATTQPVCCEICGKQYKSKCVLRNHLKTHSDDKPFICEVCGASFKTKTVLLTHKRTHSESKKYSCNICGQGFRWKQTYDKHAAKCGTDKGANE